MWDPYAEFKSVTLPNGLKVYAAHWPGRPWEAMGFLVHSGAEQDPAGLEGLAHFVEHLVSENMDVKRNDASSFFRGCGGMVDFGSTDYPSTEYHFFVPKNKEVVAKALSIFGSMLLSAKIEKSIERERQVVIREFNQRYPVRFKFDLEMQERKALYAGYWLERFARPLGNPESIGRITQNDLQSYYDTHYTPANTSIVGVGGMKLLELVKLLSKSPFAINKKGARAPIPSSVTDFALLPENRHVLEMSEYVNTATTLIEVGAYRSVTKIPGDVNVFAIILLIKIFNRILDEEVRDQRAWAYSIDSSYRSFRHFYQFSINCNALAIKALDEIEEVVETCIASIGNREDLFEQAKGQALARNFVVDESGKDICDNALDDLARYQRIVPLAEDAKNIERVTMTDIRNLLKWLQPERRWTLITKP